MLVLVWLGTTPPLAAAEAPLPPTLEAESAAPAQQNTGTIEPPPALPEDVSDSRQPIKPEVTIIHRQDATVEEYRVNGRLRYIKIIPKTGAAYYLVDLDGDGTLETRHTDLQNPPINQWLLLEW